MFWWESSVEIPFDKQIFLFDKQIFLLTNKSTLWQTKSSFWLGDGFLNTKPLQFTLLMFPSLLILQPLPKQHVGKMFLKSEPRDSPTCWKYVTIMKLKCKIFPTCWKSVSVVYIQQMVVRPNPSSFCRETSQWLSGIVWAGSSKGGFYSQKEFCLICFDQSSETRFIHVFREVSDDKHTTEYP